MNTACIFCKIVQGQIPAKIIAQRDQLIVIQDIAPKAPIHYLLIPKIHLADLSEISADHQQLAWHFFDMARELGQDVPNKSFNLVANNGAAAGQVVFHLHFHFLAGTNIYQGGLVL